MRVEENELEEKKGMEEQIKLACACVCVCVRAYSPLASLLPPPPVCNIETRE